MKTIELNLKNKSVLVTGGNRGIGLSIALGFADEGADVAICGRDLKALESAKGKIAALGVKAHAIAADLFTAEGCHEGRDHGGFCEKEKAPENPTPILPRSSPNPPQTLPRAFPGAPEKPIERDFDAFRYRGGHISENPDTIYSTC